MRNPWLYVFSIPLLLLIVMAGTGVHPDLPLAWTRVLIFVGLIIPLIIYCWSGPFIVISSDFSRPARSVIGLGVILIGIEGFQLYAWISLRLGRPDWLNDQYWNVSLWTLILCGVILIASSLGAPISPGKPARGVAIVAAFMAGIGVAVSPLLTMIVSGAKALFAAVFGRL